MADQILDIDLLRARIDEIDQELLKLLNERASIAIQIGTLKSSLGIQVLVEERERAVIRNLEKTNPGPLHATHLGRIWRAIIEVSRGLQARKTASQ